MNLHYLELFYYVGKFHGISEAVRNMPYGIQQPAISAQILQLENQLGISLFQRRPFKLTAEGEKLFRFVEPFFSNVNSVAMEISRADKRTLRIGAGDLVLSDYLPEFLQLLKVDFPQLRFALKSGLQPELEHWLLNDEIDVAITFLKSSPGSGLHSTPLVDFPLALAVPKRSRVRSPEAFWQADRIDEPLISLPPNELVSQLFQTRLAAMGIDWIPNMEVPSIKLVHHFVEQGYGTGLTVQIPELETRRNLRLLPLPDFPRATVALLRRKKSALLEAFSEKAIQFTAQLQAK